MDTDDKVWLVQHNGVYLNGVTVVVASNRRTARARANKAIVDAGLDPADICTIEKMEGNSQVVWNGDY